MYSDVITIFNFYESSTGAVWYPHVLSGVHLDTDRGQIIKKYGPDSNDNAFLSIRYENKGQKKVIKDASGKELVWLPPKEWSKQPNDELDDTITFGSNDFFMMGAWEESGVINDSDYTYNRNQGFYAYLNTDLDFVFKITAVGGPYAVIRHFEILGA